MNITLDEERWQLPDDISLMEALAQVSDKAQSKGCFVTQLTVGGRTVTDRDLQPSFLAQKGTDVVTVEAVSRSLRTIMSDAAVTMSRFSAQLKSDGDALVGGLRAGRGGFTAFDTWLGRLADYAEITVAGRTQGLPDTGMTRAFPWIQELVDAREAADAVRLADILEYELLPALPDGDR
ncbi:hypothetical protein [Nitrospira sp. Nam80]